MRRTAAAAVLLLLVAGCGWGDPGGDGGDEGTTLTVLAASSLTDVFEELATDFEAEHAGVEVELVVGSSTDLAEQAADGAPGDVLATADEESMAIAEDAGVADDPAVLAHNILVIVVPAGNPADVTALGDLADTTWVRCADEAPCGRTALAALEDAGVDAPPASLEEDARSTLDKVVSGEADAGLVYASDAVSAGDAVETVLIPDAAPPPVTYLVVSLDQSDAPDLADAFVSLLRSDAGRAAFMTAGFGTRDRRQSP